MSEVIILSGYVSLPPENMERARPHLQAMAEASRGEAGCISYSMAFDVNVPGRINIFEVFESAEALAVHRASSHMATWRASWPDLGIGDRNMWQYDVADFRKI